MRQLIWRTVFLPILRVGEQKRGAALKMHARQLVLPIMFFLCASFGVRSAYAETSPPRNGFIGIVSKADKHKVGQQFTFANLQSQRPFVTFPSGNGEETTKIFEDDEIIVLIFVANLTGSTDTFYLNKKRNRFTLIEVGALEATVTDVDFRPDITYGILK